VSYIDVSRGLRRRTDLRTTVHDCIQRLKARGLVDGNALESLWRLHQEGQSDNSAALTLLASLEIHLQAHGNG
jgi:hypothetical protein